MLLFEVTIKDEKKLPAFLSKLLQNTKITISHLNIKDTLIQFLCKIEEEKRIVSILDKKGEYSSYHYHLVSRISLIGSGIVSNHILKKVIALLENRFSILQIENTETKLSLTFSKTIEDTIANELHDYFIL